MTSLVVPGNCGVPLIRPVAESSVTPLGSAPDAICHVYGTLPPAAVSCAEYGWPAVPLGSDAVVMAKPAAIVMLNCVFPEAPQESLTEAREV